MIDAKVDCNTEVIEIRLRGTAPDFCAELAYLIRHVYFRLLEQSPLDAACMRELMGEIVSDESPVWLPDGKYEDAKEEGNTVPTKELMGHD